MPTTQQIDIVPDSLWLSIPMLDSTMVQKRCAFSTVNVASGSFPWIRPCATISSKDAESGSAPVIHVITVAGVFNLSVQKGKVILYQAHA